MTNLVGWFNFSISLACASSSKLIHVSKFSYIFSFPLSSGNVRFCLNCSELTSVIQNVLEDHPSVNIGDKLVSFLLNDGEDIF